VQRNGSRFFAATCLALALGACTTIDGGTGTGSILSSRQPVSFTWKSRDGGLTGTMSATLADGTAFTGPYLESSSERDFTQFFPMLSRWTTGWGDWGSGRFAPIDVESNTDYSGKVVANLSGPGAQRMRCAFDLDDPPSGMDGGGHGRCRFAGGAIVDATFAPL
jgi:hypothetical protein